MLINDQTVSNNTMLVVGTSRRDGNTWRVLSGANKQSAFPIVDLADLKISYFDYNSKKADDDFIPTIRRILQFKTIGLVSPVYWYSVSAQMKTFIDRFADLLGQHKELGRQLRGKGLFLLATGSSEEELPNCMEEMIQRTAKYLGMQYLGSHYVRVVEDLDVNPESILGAREFLESRGGGY